MTNKKEKEEKIHHAAWNGDWITYLKFSMEGAEYCVSRGKDAQGRPINYPDAYLAAAQRRVKRDYDEARALFKEQQEAQ